MPTYGPWQPQASDQLQFDTIFGDSDTVDPDTGLPLFEYGAGANEDMSGFQSPRYEITDLDLSDAVQAAYDVELAPGGTGNTWGVEYSWGYSLAFPDWNAVWGASVVKRRFRITRRSYVYSPVSEGFWEPGAIGIDYEGQPYSPADPWRSGPAAPVSRGISSVGSRLLGIWYAGTDGEVGSVPMADTEIVFLADRPPGQEAAEVSIASVPQPAVPSDPNVPAEAFLTSSLDLTDFVDPDLWSGVLWTRSGFAEPYKDPGLNEQGRARYGWGFENVRVDTMVRPPRWRWVFPGTPIRQTSHRDDHLAGGAYQTWPAPTSRQESNTTFGGYL